MNANIGIVLRKGDREKMLSAIPQRLRTWGGETVEEDGPQRFSAQRLDGVEFQIYPVTQFIRGCLPSKEQTQVLEYAWMTGPALDAYEVWAKANRKALELHTFEAGLAALLGQASFWAVMFAPEGERLGVRVTVGVHEALRELRQGASDVSASEGFLAMST